MIDRSIPNRSDHHVFDPKSIDVGDACPKYLSINDPPLSIGHDDFASLAYRPRYPLVLINPLHDGCLGTKSRWLADPHVRPTPTYNPQEESQRPLLSRKEKEASAAGPADGSRVRATTIPEESGVSDSTGNKQTKMGEAGPRGSRRIHSSADPGVGCGPMQIPWAGGPSACGRATHQLSPTLLYSDLAAYVCKWDLHSTKYAHNS